MVICRGRDQLLGPFFFECNIMLLCKVESIVKVSKTDHDFDDLVILAIVEQEID